MESKKKYIIRLYRVKPEQDSLIKEKAKNSKISESEVLRQSLDTSVFLNKKIK